MEYVFFDFHKVENLNKVCFYGSIIGQTYIGKIPQCNIITKSYHVSPYHSKAFKTSIRFMCLDKINIWISHIESHLKMIDEAKHDKIEIKYIDDFIQSIEISPIGSTILKYYISSRISGGADYKKENYNELVSLEKYYTNILKLLNNSKDKRLSVPSFNPPTWVSEHDIDEMNNRLEKADKIIETLKETL